MKKSLVSISSNKGLVKQLALIAHELNRIADMVEFMLQDQGLFMQEPEVDKKDDEELMYRDEEQQVKDELEKEWRQIRGDKIETDEE
jgi:hypothetical protein